MKYCLEDVPSTVAQAEFLLSLIDGHNLSMRYPEKIFYFNESHLI